MLGLDQRDLPLAAFDAAAGRLRVVVAFEPAGCQRAGRFDRDDVAAALPAQIDRIDPARMGKARGQLAQVGFAQGFLRSIEFRLTRARSRTAALEPFGTLIV